VDVEGATLTALEAAALKAGVATKKFCTP